MSRFVATAGFGIVLGALAPASADAPPGKYTVSATTVLDNGTKLTWQRKSVVDVATRQEALDYCSRLELGGFSDWRVPNMPELVSIVDDTRQDPALDTTAFQLASAWLTWTTSLLADAPNDPLLVNFLLGNNGFYLQPAGSLYAVRCVR